jgi:hypothetical protein
MRTRSLSLLLGLALAVPLGAAGGPSQTTTQYVALDNTRLLSKPNAFAKPIRILKKGMLVKAETPKNGYVKVTVPLGEDTVSGYLSIRSLQNRKPKLSAAAHASADASATEVAAATKGFNKQIEAELRRGDKADAYAKLDAALARSAVEDPENTLKDFRKKGRLGEFFKEDGE